MTVTCLGVVIPQN